MCMLTGLADDTGSQWKGKGALSLSPVLEYAAEQTSSLDHTKPGSWVWWKLEEATWMLAKVSFLQYVSEHASALPRSWLSCLK